MENNHKKKSKKTFDDTIPAIFSTGGVLSDGNKNYKLRPEQVKAATEIEKTLNKEEHFVLEGPCGFGKSLSYLVPAIKSLINNEKEKLVIVTSNISLQEQLIDKDIPFVLDKLQTLYRDSNKEVRINLKATTLKGISNFVCKQKIEDLDLGSKTLIDDPQDPLLKERDILKEFCDNTITGDISEISSLLKGLKKDSVCMDSGECETQNCSNFNKTKCYYSIQKRLAKASDIIVTNYHMFFALHEINSDVFENSDIVIFDEVHECESILREFKATSMSMGTFDYIDKRIKAIINKCSVDVSEYFADINMDAIKEHVRVFFERIDLKFYSEGNESIKLIEKQNDFPNVDDIEVSLNKIIKSLTKFRETLKQDINLKSVNEDALNMARNLKTTCHRNLDMLTKVDKITKDQNKVIWAEKKNENISIGMKNVDVSDEFCTNYLLDPNTSCILTSATISTDGTLDYLKMKLGLDKAEERGKSVNTMIGTTPFNLTKQELWYLPASTLAGNDPDFMKVSINNIENIIKVSNGGVLCLFTSVKSMNLCKEKLKESLPDYKILTQGDMSKGQILEEFRNDYNSSLLATKSFFTGVDIQGQSLRCVIIDKLPFENPSDPVYQKLNKERGAFAKYSLPGMIITLKQGVGRGVRSVEDKCVICILDQRISTANYKAKIFRSFKYKKQSTRSLDDVRNFIEKHDTNK